MPKRQQFQDQKGKSIENELMARGEAIDKELRGLSYPLALSVLDTVRMHYFYSYVKDRDQPQSNVKPGAD